MITKDVVKRKLRYLVERLEELRKFEKLSLVEYQRDLTSQRAVERIIQLIVEVACDINDHMIAGLDRAPAKDYFDSFVLMGEYGIISVQLAQSLAPAAGQRNIIVHEYEELDFTLIFDGMKKALTLFPEYIRQVLEYLDIKK